MTADGNTVGTIDKVRGNKAHVKPDANLSDSMRSQLDWTDESKSTYELNPDAVDQIKDDGIHLKESF